MKAEDLLIFGGVGLVAYLIYQSASTAASVIPNIASEISGAVQTVKAAPSMWNCGDSYMSSLMPFGTGALIVPDSYVIPCMGGATAGSLRAAGVSNAELIQTIATAECGCAAAQLPGSGVTVQGNVIVPSSGVSGYRLPAGIVRA